MRNLSVYHVLARRILTCLFYVFYDFFFRDKHEENHKPALHKVSRTLLQVKLDSCKMEFQLYHCMIRIRSRDYYSNSAKTCTAQDYDNQLS